MQMNNELIESLKSERSGIFNWLLDGYRIVREQGGFSFDMDKMKAKERRLFKRKIATVTEMLRKVFGDEEMSEFERTGILDALPEIIYREQKAYLERTIEHAKQQPGGVMGWLEEGNRKVQEKGGPAYLASKLVDMEENERENFLRELAQFMEMVQDDMSVTPEARKETQRKIDEINKLLQQELSRRNKS